MSEQTRYNAMGLLEGYDPETGEVLWVEKKKGVAPGPKKVGYPRGRPRKIDRSPTHVVLDGNGKKVEVLKGTDPSTLPRCTWPYNQITADHICDRISEGKTLDEIGLMEGYPSTNIIKSWTRLYPDFKRQLKIARAERAEHFHDEIIKLARDPSENQAKSERLKFESLKWAASVGDPDTYGNKVKHSGDPDAPIGFIVDTGIRRGEETE